MNVLMTIISALIIAAATAIIWLLFISSLKPSLFPVDIGDSFMATSYLTVRSYVLFTVPDYKYCVSVRELGRSYRLKFGDDIWNSHCFLDDARRVSTV